jgi:hypothetical protein
VAFSLEVFSENFFAAVKSLAEIFIDGLLSVWVLLIYIVGTTRGTSSSLGRKKRRTTARFTTREGLRAWGVERVL